MYKRQANNVIGIKDKNLPTIPGSTNIGINTTILINEAIIFGLAYVCIVMRIAEVGLYHFFIFSRADSMNTITVSIPIPKERISEKLTIKVMVIPR